MTQEIKKLTPRQERKIARENAIYAEYNELISRPGQSATMVTQYLSEKYDVAPCSIYVIRKRVEVRINAQK